MKGKKYDFLIVGSGMGGATLARELSRKGKEVLVVERGKRAQKIGTFAGIRHHFDGNHITNIPAKSKEGVIIWRTLMAGGSTVVACGNGVRCLEKELAERGIVLDGEFAEIERDMGIAPIHERLLSEGAKKFVWASRELGYKMELMPKFIDPAKCGKCGNCALGCVKGAKWTALDYLDEASQQGAEVLNESMVQEVLVENGKTRGVMTFGPEGSRNIPADNVILAAGALGTPVILQNSGISQAGPGLFIDLFVNTYGTTRGLNQIHEPAMAVVDLEFHQEKGFILSPFMNHTRLVRFIEIGARGLASSSKSLIGIMAKTTDDPAGCVFPDGSVSKPVTEADRRRLKEGSGISREILIKAGAEPKSIVVSRVQGGHPGGTAAVGKVVDKELQTKVDGLFVCDASVLPAAPGLPPMLTIGALAKRLAKTLAP